MPREILVFAETRKKSWFDSAETIHQLATELNRLGKGWVITDSPGRLDVVHLKLSIPKALIRFVCGGDEELDIFRISQWKEVLTHRFENGLEDC